MLLISYRIYVMVYRRHASGYVAKTIVRLYTLSYIHELVNAWSLMWSCHAAIDHPTRSYTVCSMSFFFIFFLCLAHANIDLNITFNLFRIWLVRLIDLQTTMFNRVKNNNKKMSNVSCGWFQYTLIDIIDMIAIANDFNTRTFN